jgi:hypothetical protein
MPYLWPTIFLSAVTAIVPAQDKKAVPGMPFGPITRADFDHLQAFAEANGFDLEGELARVYGVDKKTSAEALAHVFRFSLSMKEFNQDARAYGTLISISLDRIGEPYGVDYYAQILERQPAEVQQRIRDFLFYPSSVLPAQDRDEALSMLHQIYPSLFPKGYQFAQNDALFVLRDYLPDFRFTITQADGTRDLLISLANISKDQQGFVDSLSNPVPPFAFRCQFAKRDPQGAVSSLSEEFTLNTREEHNPFPPAPLSTLAPGEGRKKIIPGQSLAPRVAHALTLAPKAGHYDSIRFLLSVSVNDQLSRFIQAKSPFLNLADYVELPDSKM